MAYATPFHKIVAIGTQGADIFNWTLNVAPSDATPLGPSNSGFTDNIANLIAAWHVKSSGAGGPGHFSSVKLTSVKVNRIGTDGKYMDSTTFESVFGSPLAGSQTGAFIPQAAMCVTLRTAVARGRGSRGRFYLPPIQAMNPSALSSDGAIDGDLYQAPLVANIKDLLDDINGAYAEPGIDGLGRVSVVSNIGAGVSRAVTVVSLGRVVDTIRSRRNKLDEAYKDATLA